MSSHREAPAISNLTAFGALPTLASQQVSGAFALDALEQLDAPAVEEWHVNLNITDSIKWMGITTYACIS